MIPFPCEGDYLSPDRHALCTLPDEHPEDHLALSLSGLIIATWEYGEGHQFDEDDRWH